MAEATENTKGRVLSHQTGNDRQISRLQKLEQENQLLRQLLVLRRASAPGTLIRDLKTNLEALGHVATYGWPHSGTKAVDKRSGRRGDAGAATLLSDIEKRLGTVCDEVSEWLDEREEQVIELSKGIVG